MDDTFELPDDDLSFNPMYTGIGHWEPELDDDEWIEMACDAINELGARAFLRRMLAELRRAHGDEEDLSPEAMIALVESHLLHQRVADYTSVMDAPFPLGLLTFDDGHGLLVAPVDEDSPTLAQAEKLVGKFVVAVEVAEDDVDEASEYLSLAFHDDVGYDFYAADFPDPAVEMLDTVWESGLRIFCPERHAETLSAADTEAAIGHELTSLLLVEVHLMGKRVADRLPQPTVLIFDDGHVLPIELAGGQSQPDLEAFVGKFLVWVEVSPREQDTSQAEAYLSLRFHDNPKVATELKTVESKEGYGRVQERFEHLATELLTLEISPQSGSRIFCPQAH